MNQLKDRRQPRWQACNATETGDPESFEKNDWGFVGGYKSLTLVYALSPIHPVRKNSLFCIVSIGSCYAKKKIKESNENNG